MMVHSYITGGTVRSDIAKLSTEVKESTHVSVLKKNVKLAIEEAHLSTIIVTDGLQFTTYK